jgi:hypothetical protein
LIFKLFTGAYKNRMNPDSSKGEYKDTTKPYERGMIYFDNDGQYIQSTNYDGYYTSTRKDFVDKVKDALNITLPDSAKFESAPGGLNG